MYRKESNTEIPLAVYIGILIITIKKFNSGIFLQASNPDFFLR